MYDVKGLAQSVSAIIEKEEERRFMGRCSAEMIECFSIDSIMEKWDALFKEIIHKGS
jgi:glycosyltransferase involved in cell wall biosynthesis